MKLKLYTILFLVFLVTIMLLGLNNFNKTEQKVSKIKGLTFVAPPKKFSSNPMLSIRNINAEWISLIPYAYTPKDKAELHFGPIDWQWWGEKEEGIRECIQLAQQNNIKIMLKPQVYIHDSWTGEMEFKTELEWQKWESEYEKYILTFAKIAQEYKVELFCIGTEFVKSSEQRIEFWNQLIRKIRNHYEGLLTYSDNWDHYQKISFWTQLDFIGISAYFPLVDSLNPTQNLLHLAWQKWIEELQEYSTKQNKKILFTEYGYLSVDGSAGKSWELEQGIENRHINEQAQADAFNSLYSSLWNQSWWAGGFIWKWFPEGMGHEGYPERDYTPQGKLAEPIIKSWYSKN